jgi:hypothetical protein
MSKRVTVKPDWLDELLRNWGRKSDRQNGWYSISPMLADGIPGRTHSLEVGGYVHADYQDLERAINSLELKYRLSVIGAFKPWLRDEIVEYQVRTWLVTERTLQNWVHEAAAQLAQAMDRRNS